MKSPLKGLVIAVTGDFGAAHSHKDVQRWVEGNGGTFVDVIKEDDGVTHLICSLDDYVAKVGKVKHALKYPSISIVTFDWLEDSLLAARAKQEKAYLLRVLEKARRKVDRERKKRIKDARYTRPGRSSAPLFLCALHSFYADAFTAFTQFFLSKTGRRWEDRLESREETTAVVGGSADEKETRALDGGHGDIGEEVREKRSDERVVGMDQRWVYKPPVFGRPRGVLPLGWVERDGEGRMDREGCGGTGEGVGGVCQASEAEGDEGASVEKERSVWEE
ncbi:MAG: hypothetical protein M1817_004097 [Caeruleum heppii]|nr:MAG: hypothetical protein M1817_004097 [Caeruleum heppii]